jgi:putative transposase
VLWKAFHNTYIPTDEGWLYLASVIDLGSRRLLGWSMGEAHDADLVCNAAAAAVAARGRDRMDGTVFHSDRGSEYTSAKFRQACTNLGLRQSTGRTGSCLDNAVAEAFFATLKVELVNRRRFRTRAEARTAIFAWLHYYNARRLHSTLQHMTPLEWEQQHDLTDPVPSPLAA